MPPPDLANPTQRAAYRRELRGLARGPRIAGLLLVLAGVATWFWPRIFGGPWWIAGVETRYVGWALIALGWMIWAYVIWYRSRYHRRRMAGG